MALNLPTISMWKEKMKDIAFKKNSQNFHRSRKIKIPWLFTLTGHLLSILSIFFVVIFVFINPKANLPHDKVNTVMLQNAATGRPIENSTVSEEFDKVHNDSSFVHNRPNFGIYMKKIIPTDFTECVFMILVVLLLFILFGRRYFEYTYEVSLREFSGASLPLTSELRICKYKFLKDVPDKEKSGNVSINEFGLHNVFNSLELYNLGKFREVKCTMKDFMLANWENFTCRYSLRNSTIFIDAILWIHDLLKTVEWMHRKNMYHLDLQPETVSLHWLEYGEKWYQTYFLVNDNTRRHECMNIKQYYKKVTDACVVLGQVDHALRSRSKEVASKLVGLTEFYKPPECFSQEKVDASKIDSWGVGIVAFEILTGGMLAIKAQSNNPPSERCSQVLKQVLTSIFVSSAIDGSFCVIDNFVKMGFNQMKVSRYNLEAYEFLTECWKFLEGMLNPDPMKRLSVEEALKLPLIRRVKNHQHKICVNTSF